MVTRDTQKQRVYDAEIFVRRILDSLAATDVRTFDFYGSNLVIPAERKFGDLEGVQRYVDGVLALNWVRATWEAAERPITIRPRKGNRFAHYERWPDPTIAVPDHQGGISWAMREVVVLHEIAHHLTPLRGHGPVFVGNLLRLVTEIIGPEVGLLLTDSYVNHGVETRHLTTV